MTLDAVRKTRCVGGLVHPGPDWIKPALPEGSTDAQAFVLPGGITKIDGRNATANVAWPLLAEDDPNAVVWVNATHSIGGQGPDGSTRYELVYAPYKKSYL